MDNKLKKMYKGMANSPETFLMEELSEFETMPESIMVQSTAGFPDEGYLTLETTDQVETIKYEGKTDDKFTNITRDVEGTGIYTWKEGVEIARNFNNIDYETLVDNIKIINDDIEDDVKPSIGALEEEIGNTNETIKDKVNPSINALEKELEDVKDEIRQSLGYTIASFNSPEKSKKAADIVLDEGEDLGEIINELLADNDDGIASLNVYLAAGDFTSIESIVLENNNLSIQGVGEAACIKSIDGVFVRIQGGSSFTLKDLKIDHNTDGIVCINVLSLGASNDEINLENCVITSSNNFITIRPGSELKQLRLRNCSLRDFKRSLLYNTGSINKAVINNIYAINIDDTLIWSAGGSHIESLQLSDNRVIGFNGLIGVVYSASLGEVQIINNYVKNSSHTGISIEPPLNNALIMGNIFENSTNQGLFLDRVSSSIISNNIFKMNYYDDTTYFNYANMQLGIYNNEDARANNNMITNNLFIGGEDPQSNKGVYIWGHGNTVVHNKFTGNWNVEKYGIMFRGDYNIDELSGNHFQDPDADIPFQPEEILQKAAPLNLEIPEMINEDVEGELSIKSPPAENEENIEKED